MARVMPKLYTRTARHAPESPVAWQREERAIIGLLVAADVYASILGDPTAPIVREHLDLATQIMARADQRAFDRVVELRDNLAKRVP